MECFTFALISFDLSRVLTFLSRRSRSCHKLAPTRVRYIEFCASYPADGSYCEPSTRAIHTSFIFLHTQKQIPCLHNHHSMVPIRDAL
jgi:hypothetical protein